MALKSPLMPSPSGNGASPAFSPFPASPNSPARFGNQFATPRPNQSNRSSGATDSLVPPSPYPSHIEPSPTDSNGTEGTDIDEDAQDEAQAGSPMSAGASDALDLASPDIEITSPASAASDMPPRLDTQLPAEHRFGNNEDGPQSVIHIPTGFRNFEEARSKCRQSPTQGSDNTVVSPLTPDAANLVSNSGRRQSSVSPVNTDVPRYLDRSTPRAQTRQELEEDYKRKSRRTPSLEGLLPGFDRYFKWYLTMSADIPEGHDKDGDERHDTGRGDDAATTTAAPGPDSTAVQVSESLSQAGGEVAALRTALTECWTLCNTLAGLSSTHRTRTFKFTGKTEVQEQAWRSCWRLCQQLYEKRDEDHTSQVVPTLEMCREFCQALFDARQKSDEGSDSVLRVSFELNNHLYNTHDTKLPDAFNERTLDFYITLCHRLMKQQTSLPQETDALLRACWDLAEMLFNLRQGRRDGKEPDEESLCSAVQACWELCDLFREGWSQVRPDRGTPRPGQRGFGSSQQSLQSSSRSNRSENRSSSSTRSRKRYRDPRPFPPETPITIFDDASTAASSPESTTVPNILVLGPASTGTNSLRGGSGGGGGGGGGTSGVGGGGGSGTHHERWTSSASVLSDYSESASSQRSSSTATGASVSISGSGGNGNGNGSSGGGGGGGGGGEDTQLVRIRYLLLKAGLNTGYARSANQPLPAYVQTLPDDAFGTLPWQMKVLSYYRRLVTHDKSMLSAHALPPRRLRPAELARAVRWLGGGEQWAWMRDLFRLVLGFGIDEVERRGGGGSEFMI